MGIIIVVKDISEQHKIWKQLEQQTWLVTHTAQFGRIVLEATSFPGLSQELISKLTPFLDCSHGLIHVLDQQTDSYRLQGSYGRLAQTEHQHSFVLGETLSGQCAMEGKIIHLKEVPELYFNINSGLGNATPREIVLIPICFQDKALAVIEIASFNHFQKQHMIFLQELIPIVGLGMNNLLRKHATKMRHLSEDKRVK